MFGSLNVTDSDVGLKMFQIVADPSDFSLLQFTPFLGMFGATLIRCTNLFFNWQDDFFTLLFVSREWWSPSQWCRSRCKRVSSHWLGPAGRKRQYRRSWDCPLWMDLIERWSIGQHEGILFLKKQFTIFPPSISAAFPPWIFQTRDLSNWNLQVRVENVSLE